MYVTNKIFTVFATIVFATTSAFSAQNCQDTLYRYNHPEQCTKNATYSKTNAILSIIGGGVLIGGGIALAMQTSSSGDNNNTYVGENYTNLSSRFVLSSNVHINYNQNETVKNQRVAAYNLNYEKDFTNNDIIKSIKISEKYQRNYKQYDNMNYAVANARGFTGKNISINIIDNFQNPHGDTVYDIAQYVAPDARLTKTDISQTEYNIKQFQDIANTINQSGTYHIYNASWQTESNIYTNAATAIYDNQTPKTYASAQQYLYNVSNHDFITQIRNTAIDNDAIFVWAAGNESQPESGVLSALPLAFPEIQGHFVNVVALDNSDKIAWYSNQCGVTQNYCIAAPGSGWNTQTQSFASGTSFATPAVSGAIAIIKEAFPYMNANQITQLLFVTARDLGDPGVDSVYGWGALDLDKATRPVGQPKIVLANNNVVPLNTISVSGIAANAIKNANVKIAFVDDFGRTFTTNLSDNINVVPYGRGFDKLRESDDKSVTLFNNFEMGFKENHLLESSGFISIKSEKYTNFVGYKTDFTIDNIRFYHNTRIGATNPKNEENTIVSGFSNIYTASIKSGVQIDNLSFEFEIPEYIFHGNMFLNIPIARDYNGNIIYNNTNVNMATKPDLAYTLKYRFLSATMVDNHDTKNEFFVMAKTKIAF